MTSEMSTFDVLEEPSFTLPARPGLLPPEPLDLLADPEPRRLPEGTVSGFAVIGALVAFSCLVGGFTAGLVVIGVSTLLAATAAIVRGDASLSPVGGQRGAAVLLGAAVTALIVGSVTTHEHRPAPEVADGVPVPVSSPFAVSTQTAYAALPPAGDSAGSAGSAGSTGSGGSAAPSHGSSNPAVSGSNRPAVPRVAVPAATPAVVPTPTPATAPGLTLSLDALSPKVDPADVRAGHQADDQGSDPGDKAPGPRGDNGKGSATNGGKNGGKSADKGSGVDTDKASEKAAKKAAEKAAKAREKAAKAALAKAAEAAAAEAKQARAVVQGATNVAVSATSTLRGLSSASAPRHVLGFVKKAGTKVERATAEVEKKAVAKAGQKGARQTAKTAKQTVQQASKNAAAETTTKAAKKTATKAAKKTATKAAKSSGASATSGR